MRKYVLILIGLVFTAIVAGCGGSGGSATVVPGNTTTTITTDEVASLTFKNQSSAGFPKSQFNSDKSATWGNKAGTWQVSNGNIVFTETITGGATTAETKTFTRIQTESTYWLVFDATTKNIARLFFDDNAFAPGSQKAIDFNGFKPARMGGAVLGGTELPSSVNVTAFAGSLTTGNGKAGFEDTTSATPVPTFNQPLDITYDDINKKYYVLDYNNGAIRVIDTAGIVTTQVDDAQVKIALNAPQGITTDGTSIFVSDTNNHVIRQIDIATKKSTIFAGTLAVSGAVDTTGTGAAFKFPAGITTDGTNLYVADSGNHTIRKIVISSKAVTTLAGSAGNIGTADGVFSTARFNAPVRLTTDGSNLYVTDFNNRTVRTVQIATGEVGTLAGNAGAKAAQVDTSLGVTALFFHPTGITTDGTNLYVTDFNNIILPKPGTTPSGANLFSNKIRKVVISNGTVSTIAGGKHYPDIAREGVGITGDTETNDTDALFGSPRGIIWDGTNLLVTNGATAFDTDGLSIFNPTSVFNVIFKVSK